MFTCQKCDLSYEDLNQLKKHSSKIHNLSTEDVYVFAIHANIKPVCACGCGSLTKFYDIKRGYSKYAWGHAARVNNNWGHNPDALEKSIKKRRDEELWSKVPWNKGKTKENDPEFAIIAEKAYGTDKFRKARAENMRSNRLSKIVPNLTGDKHPQWKGGASSLANITRSLLYVKWTYPHLKEGRFKCAKCEATGNLTVHHDKEKFADIMYSGIEMLGDPGETFEAKSKIAEWIVDYHVDNKVSGIVFCVDCHRLAHSKQIIVHQDSALSLS